MRLLIIGGTRFLGRALVEAALAAGDDLTLFNRGLSNPNLFPAVEQINGDRDSELHLLAQREWDGVIDTCGYIPRHVRAAATALRDRVAHYTFISTISVYADPPESGLDEDSPLATLEDELAEEVTGETYGGLKVLCEQAVDEVMGGRALHVRSGLIVGPHDPTDRFTYWPVRVAAGGEVLAPAARQSPVQFIDVRDLAQWTLEATRRRLRGPFSVTGPTVPLNMSGLLGETRSALESDAALTWVSEAFLLAHDVTPWQHLPLWLPADAVGMARASVARAVDVGLTTRPLSETVRDTLAWHRTREGVDDTHLGQTLSREREAELLRKWRMEQQHV
jgi:2'-hydroxyisoflavone reductase